MAYLFTSSQMDLRIPSMNGLKAYREEEVCCLSWELIWALNLSLQLLDLLGTIASPPHVGLGTLTPLSAMPIPLPPLYFLSSSFLLHQS